MASLEYKNFLDIKDNNVGKERRLELMSDILNNGTFLPKPVTYKDIDEDFRRWVEESLVITSEDGKEFPTMSLFSNQRFSEYTQSWKYTDINNNLMLNFKTISRDNYPQYGKIQNGYWNIPGVNRFYTMKKKIVLDDNGSESFLLLKMRQPTSIDFNYRLSIFTTKYESINTFNTLINKSFNSRQCYIRPNGHYMPMTLESISDESSYQIDDRQFYGQTYNIKIMGYIITEDDYRVEEVPLKRGLNIPQMPNTSHSPDVEIEECDNNEDVKLTIYFPLKCNKNMVHFTNDTKFLIKDLTLDNILNNYKLYVNGDIISKKEFILLNCNDEIKIVCQKIDKNKEAKFIINGTKNENIL